ncbi:MAG: hypothetical protein ACREBS_00425 [Nitrososphaerales archaeon]
MESYPSKRKIGVVLTLVVLALLVAPSLLGINQNFLVTSLRVSAQSPTNDSRYSANSIHSVSQSVESSASKFVFNSTGLFWGSGVDMMELKLPTLSVATTKANCAIAQTSTLKHNSTTYIYSLVGSVACADLVATSNMKLYVDNTSSPLSREVIVSGTVTKVGSGAISNILSMPLILPANVSLGSNYINSTDDQTGFNWSDMSQFSPAWNNATGSLTVASNASSAGITRFYYDPVLQTGHNSGVAVSSVQLTISPDHINDLLAISVGSNCGSASSISDSQSNTYTEVTSDYANGSPHCNAYTSVWYSRASATTSDTITINVGAGSDVDAFVVDVSDVSTIGITYSSGTGTYSTVPSVSSFVPSSTSFVIGTFGDNVGCQDYMQAGSGYTLMQGTYRGDAEYAADWASGSTTAPFSAGQQLWEGCSSSSYVWAEVAVAFPTTIDYGTINSAETGVSEYLAGLTGNCNFGSAYCAPSEYYSVPISIRYSDGSFSQVGNLPIPSGGSLDCVGFETPISSSAENEYTTNETIQFYEDDHADSTCYGDSPDVNVYAYWDYSSTEIEVCVEPTSIAEDSYAIYLGSEEIVSDPSENTAYCLTTSSHSGSIPNGWFDSSRYEFRSGAQQAAGMYEAGASSADGFGSATNGFNTMMSAYSVTTGEDIYAPVWYFTNTGADSSDYGVSDTFAESTSAYYDCSLSSLYTSDLEIMYNSKVCDIGTSNYVTLSEDDTLIPELTALQILVNTGADTYVSSNICGNAYGGGTCHTPNQVANYILDNYELTQSGNVVGIYSCLDIVDGIISCDRSIAQGVATIAMADLLTVLAYGLGESNYTSIANTLVQDVLNAQQTSATFTDDNGNTYYRSLNVGSIFVGWDGYSYAPPNSFITTYIDDAIGMTADYKGLGTSNQETNFAALAMLCAYNYYANGVSNSCGGS